MRMERKEENTEKGTCKSEDANFQDAQHQRYFHGCPIKVITIIGVLIAATRDPGKPETAIYNIPSYGSAPDRRLFPLLLPAMCEVNANLMN